MNRLLLLFLVSITVGLGAAEKPDYFHPRRFLILLDVSMSMKDESRLLRQSVYDLVNSGFNDLMRPGDVFEIWTFNQNVHNGGYAPVVWVPEKKTQEANAAAEFARKLRFARDARMGEAVSEFVWASRDQEVLTVVIISDGQSELVGTPFDTVINEVYSYNLKSLQRARKLFYTSFVLEKGQITGWDVCSEVESIALPKLAKVTQSLDAIVKKDDKKEVKKAVAQATNEPPKKTVGIVVGPVPPDSLSFNTPGSGPDQEKLRPSPIRNKAPLEPAVVPEEPTKLTPSPLKATQADKPTEKPTEKAADKSQPVAEVKSLPPVPPEPIKEAATPAPKPQPVSKEPVTTADKKGSTPTPPPVPPSVEPAKAPATEPVTPPAAVPNPVPPVTTVPGDTNENPSEAAVPVPAPDANLSAPTRPPETQPANPQTLAAQFNPAENSSSKWIMGATALLLITAILCGLFIWRKSRHPGQNSLITQSMRKNGP